MACERLEVLDDGGQVELVASASETSQAHSLEAMMDLQVREAHLYFLTLMARLFKLKGAFLVSGHDSARLR